MTALERDHLRKLSDKAKRRRIAQSRGELVSEADRRMWVAADRQEARELRR